MTPLIISKLYPLKLWLTSIAIAPILILIIGRSNLLDMNLASLDFAMLLVIVIVGLLFSLPVLLTIYITYWLTIKRISKPILVKAIINAVSIAGALLTFISIQGTNSFNWNGNRSGLIFSLIYSVSIVIASTFFRIDKRQMNSL